MNALYVICSESCVIDSATNRTSIINIYEDLRAATFPIVLAQIYTVVQLQKDPGDRDQFDARITFTLAGNQIFEIPITGDFQTAARTRVIAHLQGLSIPTPGLMRVAFTVQGAELGSWDINVHQIAP